MLLLTPPNTGKMKDSKHPHHYLLTCVKVLLLLLLLLLKKTYTIVRWFCSLRIHISCHLAGYVLWDLWPIFYFVLRFKEVLEWSCQWPIFKLMLFVYYFWLSVQFTCCRINFTLSLDSCHLDNKGCWSEFLSALPLT